MPRHADIRQRSRGPQASNWLTGTLLVVGLTVAGVYCIWGDAPLERTWSQLGFGRANSGLIRSHRPASEVPHVSVIDTMEFPGSEASNDGFESTTALADEESTSANFLPRGRAHSSATDRSPFVDEAANAELDRRFDTDALAEKSASINTAVFSDQRSEKNESAADAGGIQDRVERSPSKPPKPNPPRRQNQPRTSNLDARSKSSDIQLTAGEETTAPAKILNPAARPRVQANPTTNSSGVPRLNLNEITAFVEQGRDAEAYQKLSEAWFQFPSQRPLFQAQLDDVSQRIYFSPQTQIQPAYEIQPGDQLRKIASKYHLSWQYLSRLNQVDAKKIRPGKLLKVFQGPFKARVDLSDFQLTVFLNGQYVKSYPVGIGKMNTTPIGEFTVREKLENPTYFGPNGMVLAPDDPQNPLGERWIDIGNSFGIHGTIEPDSIGKSESAGCIRMRNEDVAEVYDLLTVGSTVRIQR